MSDITEDDVRRHLTQPDVRTEDIVRSIAVANMLQACDPDRSAANAALIAQAIHETRTPSQPETSQAESTPTAPTVRIDRLIIHRSMSRSLRIGIGLTEISQEDQEPPTPA